MKTSRLTLAEIIGAKSMKPTGQKRLSRETAAYLLGNSRTNELDSLLRDVWQYWAEHGYVEVIASSAFSLSAKVQADIRRQIRALYPQAKQIIITERRDPEVVGGVRLELPNQQLDLSLRAKLNEFRQLTTGDQA
jgi:F0F1-type ATP synthase delta subunit